MEIKTIGIACDHAGFPLKQYVLQYLEEHGYPYKDYGTYSDQSSDYPDFAHALAEGIESGEVYPGIGICGSGEGMAMTQKTPRRKSWIGLDARDCATYPPTQRRQCASYAR